MFLKGRIKAAKVQAVMFFFSLRIANKSIGAAQLMTSGNTMYQELMSRIQQTNRAKDILISTSKYMERLFSHYGFKTYQIIKDGFGEGLDKYKMKKAY